MPRGDGPAPSPAPAAPAAAAAAAAAVAQTGCRASSSPPPPHTPCPASTTTTDGSRTAKRRAAEAALSRRFGGGERTSDASAATAAAAACAAHPPPGSGGGGGGGGGGSGGVVTVPPCAAQTPPSASTRDASPPPPPPPSWCGRVPVTIHRWAWPALAGGDVALVPPSACPARHHAAGQLTASIVDDVEALPQALHHLRASMRDALVAIDLEWSPDRGRRRRPGRPSPSPPLQPSPVGLVQLASGSHALLIRVCCLAGRGADRRSKGRAAPPPLPPCLAAFLADPAITVVGFAWDSGDEAKAVATWGVGRHGGLFARSSFIDAQAVARAMGYARLGLGALAARVLGVALPKCAATARSDWGAAGVALSPKQVRYAALDALAAGHLLRGLRLLHAHGGGECPGCAVPVGVVVAHGGGEPACARAHTPACPPASLTTCGGCGAAFVDGQALANHARATGCGEGGACAGCGRWVGGGSSGGGGQAVVVAGRKRKR